jgi:hypothetical protein
MMNSRPSPLRKDDTITSLFSENTIIQQQEKIVTITQQLEEKNNALALLQDEISVARAMLLRAIIGDNTASDGSVFLNVSLGNLVTTFLHRPTATIKLRGSQIFTKMNRREEDAPPDSEEWAIKSLKKSERALSLSKKQIAGLQSNQKMLLSILPGLNADSPLLTPSKSSSSYSEASSKSTENLRKKQQSLNEQIWNLKKKLKEKTQEAMESKQKNLKLGEQIEKIMYHLKAEVAAKAVLSSRLERSQRQTAKQIKLRDDARHKSRKLQKTITQLHEGCRVLEEQLRMLDLRFLDMKRTLDWTRMSNLEEMKSVGAEFVKLHTEIKGNYEKYRKAQDKLTRLIRDVREEKKRREMEKQYRLSVQNREPDDYEELLDVSGTVNRDMKDDEGSD